MNKKKLLQDASFLLILLILVITFLFSGLQILESTVLYTPESGTPQLPSKTIVRDGVEYYPRQDITVVMVLGIDQSGPVVSSNYYRNDGSADSIMLLIFDETRKNCSVLYLNRDTMLDMDVLGVRGEYAGTAFGQLALAHTYGSGLEDSCKNVKSTLENYLHGLSVDYYVAMNTDALPILNDAVGGVTVNVTDDFSRINPSITMGELTLRGDQVIDFVRTRKDVGDQTNATRMQRQEEYVNGFLQAMYHKIAMEPTFLLTAYEEAAPYLLTDCSPEALNSLLSRYKDYTLAETVTPEGSNLIEDGHYAFYADEEKLDSLILELFYAPKHWESSGE